MLFLVNDRNRLHKIHDEYYKYLSFKNYWQMKFDVYAMISIIIATTIGYKYSQ